MKEKNKLVMAIDVLQYLLIVISVILILIFRDTNITIRLYLCVFNVFIKYIILYKKHKRKNFIISF